ncbi:MAG: hypothetical protein ACTSW4_01445, partial [Candidatus Ranarchaeia archaeon]
MPETQPRYWGSWKGRVIKAISIDGARTWEEIRDHTGLWLQTLKAVLRELFNAKAIEKREDATYRVSHELYYGYKHYFENQQGPQNRSEKSSLKPVKFSQAEQEDLIRWIDNWPENRHLDLTLKPAHFFLDSDHLDTLAKDLISQAKQEILVVKPYIEYCSLTNILRDVSSSPREIRVVTRPPDVGDKPSYLKKRQQDMDHFH